MIKISNEDYLCLFIRDVTLRKQSEERLRTVHVAIQNSGNGIAITDLDANLKYHNPALSRLLAVEEDDKLDEENIISFIHDVAIVDTIISTVTEGIPWSGELEMRCQNDSSLYVQASVAPNTNSDGEIIGMVWSILDISEQKRAQHELQERNAQMEEELSLAREFQQAFIQADYPILPPGATKEDTAMEFGHIYLPCGAVGGDFFEIFAVSNTKVGIFISDVMGHGVRSALVVATIRGLIEELGALRSEPASFISQMNRDLTRIIKHHGHVTFSTAFYAVIDITTGEITYTSAGHPAPFILRSKSNTVEMLQTEEDKLGPALGIFDLTVYEQSTNKLDEGDTIMLYTDGIFEAENEETCKCFETDRVAKNLAQNIDRSTKEILDTLLAGVRDFCNRDSFADDVCLIGAKLKKLIPSNGS